MAVGRRVWIAGLATALAACGGPRPTPSAAAPPPAAAAPTPAVADDAGRAARAAPVSGQPIPPPPRRDWFEQIDGVDEPRLPLANGHNAADVVVLPRPTFWRGDRVVELGHDRKSDYWSPCVREFVQTQPEDVRLALGEALSLYSTSCTTGPARRIEFRTPRIRRGPSPSHLGVAGALGAATCELALVAAWYGAPIEPERITLIADGVAWTSPRIDFEHTGGGEIATLPLSRSLIRVVRRAIDARDTLLRFESQARYEDLAVTDEMKQDLRAVLDALDAINRP